jgi:hypothetical protein
MENLNRMNADNFVGHFRSIHGDKYDYSKFVYIGSLDKGEVICSHHGSFMIDPNNHKKGHGCDLCPNLGGKKAKFYCIGAFRKDAKEKYGDKFNYPELIGKSDNEKITKRTKIKIVCSIHHDEIEEKVIENFIDRNKHGCRKCAAVAQSLSNYSEDKGKTLTDYPEYAEKLKLWCYDLNKIGPKEYNKSSRDKVWWKCNKYPDNKDHIHEMSIKNKLYNDQDCPICAGVVVVKGENSFSSVKDFKLYWDPSLNPGVDPDKLTKSCNTTVNLRCPINTIHIFSMRVCNFYHGERCGICAGKRVDSSNSFEAKYPNLVKYWNMSKNNKGPDEISYGSGKPIW